MCESKFMVQLINFDKLDLKFSPYMTHVILGFTTVNNSRCSLEVVTPFVMLKSKPIY